MKECIITPLEGLFPGIHHLRKKRKKKRKTTINKITTQYEQGSPSVTQIENYKFTYGTIWR